MTCPLAITRAGTPVAAMAEQMAYLAESKGQFRIFKLQGMNVAILVS